MSNERRSDVQGPGYTAMDEHARFPWWGRVSGKPGWTAV